MIAAGTTGRLASILRYPVKSMLGEVVHDIELISGGVAGDRAYALVDEASGKVVSVKRPKRWGRIFELSATTEPAGVIVAFPDGRRLHIDDHNLPGALTAFFGRRVSIAAVPPEGASFDELWVRHLKNEADPYFGAPSRTEDGDEIVDAGGLMSALGTFFNFGAVHLVTTSSLRRLRELAPGSQFEASRFRPNFVVDTDDSGFVETEWQGRQLSIGGARLSVSFTVPRCVMTTLPQGDLPADPNVLLAITRHNAVDTFGTGVRYPCVGVYADVVGPGRVAVGDLVAID